MISEQMSQSIELQHSKSFLFGNILDFYTPIETKMRSTLNWMEAYQRDVSPKVGALERRDYTIRKPLLKVGKKEFVNTYSPFENF